MTLALLWRSRREQCFEKPNANVRNVSTSGRYAVKLVTDKIIKQNYVFVNTDFLNMNNGEKKCRFCEDFLFLVEIDKKADSNIKRRYTAAIVDEIIKDRKPRNRYTQYTGLKIKYCPYCGRKF